MQNIPPHTPYRLWLYCATKQSSWLEFIPCATWRSCSASLSGVISVGGRCLKEIWFWLQHMCLSARLHLFQHFSFSFCLHFSSMSLNGIKQNSACFAIGFSDEWQYQGNDSNHLADFKWNSAVIIWSYCVAVSQNVSVEMTDSKQTISENYEIRCLCFRFMRSAGVRTSHANCWKLALMQRVTHADI